MLKTSPVQLTDAHCRCSNISLFSKIPQLYTFRGRSEIDEVLANGCSDCTASISWCRHLLIRCASLAAKCGKFLREVEAAAETVVFRR